MSSISEWQEVFSHRVNAVGECLVFTGAKDEKGYGRVGYKSKIWLAHRLSYKISYGEIEKPFVCHKCDNPACVRPDHLFEGTNRDNVRDMMEKNRQQKMRGEKHSQARITEEQAREIRRDTRLHREIAESYGVSLGHVANIKSGLVWKHLDSEIVSNGYARGEDQPGAKLSEDDVRAIRKDERKYQEIAAEYGVTRQNIRRIKLRETWGHVE